MAAFRNEINRGWTKPPLKFNGHLPNLWLTALSESGSRDVPSFFASPNSTRIYRNICGWPCLLFIDFIRRLVSTKVYSLWINDLLWRILTQSVGLYINICTVEISKIFGSTTFAKNDTIPKKYSYAIRSPLLRLHLIYIIHISIYISMYDANTLKRC